MSSSRRSRSSRSRQSSNNDDAQIQELVAKLHQLLPHDELHPTTTTRRHRPDKVTAKMLHETCNYIKSLHKEVGDLSVRLSQVLETMEDTSQEATLIRSFITYYASIN